MVTERSAGILLRRAQVNSGGMCCTNRTGSGKPAGNSGRIAPNAFGPHVETPMATTLGRTLSLCATGLCRETGPPCPTGAAAAVAAARRTGCSGKRKNCLILGISSSRSRAIERSSEPSFEALAT